MGTVQTKAKITTVSMPETLKSESIDKKRAKFKLSPGVMSTFNKKNHFSREQKVRNIL